MEGILFAGQQSDERVLTVISPHDFTRYVAFAKIIGLSAFFVLILVLIGSVIPQAAGLFRLTGIGAGGLLLTLGLAWTNKVYTQSKTYITDRRIIRFDIVSPVFTAKRELFWHDALKAKSYQTNLIWRLLKIGNVHVETQAAEHEDVRLTNVYLFDDLANYIDKILFAFKNNPAEIASIKPFVAKPRGQRDA